MKADSAMALAPALALLLSLSASAQTSPPPSSQGRVAPPSTSSAPPTPPLADVSFLAGSWTDVSAGKYSEEVWTAPTGDSMEGMWRSVADGKVQIYMLATIREEAGGLVLRIRHFDAELVPREEKALALKLAEKRERYARFEGPSAGAAGPVTLVYKRDGNVLNVTLTKDGKSQEFRFQMKRWGGTQGAERFRHRRSGQGPSS